MTNAKRILIVEDETPITDIIRRYLARCGYEVAGAVTTGEDALAQAARLQPDLALMDVNLAGALDGVQTAEVLYSRFDIPVVFLTGLADDATLERSQAARAFGYVLKPFRQEDLKSSIDLAFTKHAGESRLRRVEQSLGAAVRSIGDGVITTDPRGLVTFLNPVAETLTGCKLAEAHGRPLAEIFQAAPGAGRQAMLRAPTGRETPVEYTAAPILGDNGESAGRVLVFRDITERRRADEELNRSRDQLRSLAAHLQGVREAERARIAREVHDQLGQMLTGLRMDAGWLDKRAQELPDAALRAAMCEKLAAMRALIDETVGTVRRIAAELRPGVLDDLGLVAALEWQAREWQARTGIECMVSAKPAELEIPPEPATALFRIFQESLTNVARHAGAKVVKGCLTAGSGFAQLEVHDNGRGISEEDQRRARSLGLVGMRERAAMLGGTFQIHGEPGRGTTVTVRLPLAVGR